MSEMLTYPSHERARPEPRKCVHHSSPSPVIDVYVSPIDELGILPPRGRFAPPDCCLVKYTLTVKYPFLVIRVTLSRMLNRPTCKHLVINFLRRTFSRKRRLYTPSPPYDFPHSPFKTSGSYVTRAENSRK